VIQRHIQESAYHAQVAIDSGRAVVVGVNRFTDQGSPETAAGAQPHDVFRVDPEVERRQVDRVRQLRARRHAAGWRAALAQVRQAARDGTNLVAPIIAAVEARATVGEISDAMREEFGEFREGATA
jgi:methylmalonyl-CoA mutase N-terminal domain/subunit